MFWSIIMKVGQKIGPTARQTNGWAAFLVSQHTGIEGPTDNDLKWTKIPYVTYGTDLSQWDHVLYMGLI